MNNFKQPGNTITLTAPTGGVVSGGVYKIGQAVVVAKVDAAETFPFEALRVGLIKDVPKDDGFAWAEGQALYWDDVAKEFTSSPSSEVCLAGFAASAALQGDTTGEIVLDGSAQGAPGLLESFSNATRPDPTTVPSGTAIFNTDDLFQNISDGVHWYDTSGNIN